MTEAQFFPWRRLPGCLPESLWPAGERSRELTPLLVHRYHGRHDCRIASWHDVWELMLVFQGHGLLHADETLPLGPAHAYLVPPGLRHRESSVAPMDVLWIGLDGALCNRLPQQLLRLDPERELARRLWLCTQRRAQRGGLAIDGLARFLLAGVHGHLDRTAIPGPLPLDACIEHLHRHHARALTLADLARRFGCSERHFTRIFTRHTGLPPLRYLRRIRIENAQRLLADRSLSVGEVARLVGYQDPAYFCRAFRAETGGAPSTSRTP